jgi:hypothetical protein
MMVMSDVSEGWHVFFFGRNSLADWCRKVWIANKKTLRRILRV